MAGEIYARQTIEKASELVKEYMDMIEGRKRNGEILSADREKLYGFLNANIMGVPGIVEIKKALEEYDNARGMFFRNFFTSLDGVNVEMVKERFSEARGNLAKLLEGKDGD